MRFEARDLKDYAEPVSLKALRINGVYFSVQFLDEEMLIPILNPLIFLGRNLCKGDHGLLDFQDFDSYRQGVRLRSSKESRQSLFPGCAVSWVPPCI